MQKSRRPSISPVAFFSVTRHLFGHAAIPTARSPRQLIECSEGFAIAEGKLIDAVMGKQKVEANKACGLTRIRRPQKADYAAVLFST